MVKFYGKQESGLFVADGFLTGCWVDMVNPGDDECDEIAAAAGIPEDMIKAALDEEERARTEFDEGCSM